MCTIKRFLRIDLVFMLSLASLVLPLQPANAGPAAQVVAPPTEVTLSGYLFAFEGVDYNGNGTSTWRYFVEPQSPDFKLGNWILEIPCDLVVSATPSPWDVVNPDPKTQISGIRWDVPGDFSSGAFSVTVEGYRLPGTNQVAAKTGPDITAGSIAGPSCAENQPPQAVDDHVTTTQGNELIISVLSNDNDPDGQVLYLAAFDAATSQGGTVTRQDMGTPGDTSDDRLLYTPPATFVTEDRFTYSASDGIQSDTAMVIVQVEWEGETPIANPDTYTVHSGRITVASPGVLENDSLPTGLVWQAILISSTSHGTLNLKPDGSFVYTPVSGYVGNDSFSYYAESGDIASEPATVTINVPDELPPTVTWLKPTTAGSRYDVANGQIVTLLVQAVDNQGIARVEFWRWDAVNEAYVPIAKLTDEPYQTKLNASVLNLGWNQVYVIVYDTSDNRAEDQYIWLFKTDTGGGQGIMLYLPIVPKGT